MKVAYAAMIRNAALVGQRLRKDPCSLRPPCSTPARSTGSVKGRRAAPRSPTTTTRKSRAANTLSAGALAWRRVEQDEDQSSSTRRACANFLADARALRRAPDAAIVVVDAVLGRAGDRESLAGGRRGRLPRLRRRQPPRPRAREPRANAESIHADAEPHGRSDSAADRRGKSFRGVIDLVAQKAHDVSAR